MLIARNLRRAAINLPPRAIYTTPRWNATASGYGDPDGTGFGASLDRQSEKVEHEHPGPPPVNEGKGTGSGEVVETSKPSNASSHGSHSKSKPQPKINPVNIPGGEGDEEVQRHNKEMSQRYGKASKSEQHLSSEKVDKRFWSSVYCHISYSRSAFGFSHEMLIFF
jgi:hypothetical protein